MKNPESKWSQKQSDFYVSKQVALLQSSESNADDPKTIEETVEKIIHHNPDLAQVHYLAYLNALRSLSKLNGNTLNVNKKVSKYFTREPIVEIGSPVCLSDAVPTPDTQFSTPMEML